MLTFTKVMSSLSLRFQSGNTVPIESARITKEEWDIIQDEIQSLNEALYEYQVNGDK